MNPTLLAEMQAEADAAPRSTEDSLKRLQEFGQTANELALQVDDLETELSQKKAELRRLLEREMTTLMDDAGVTSVTVGNRIYTIDEYCKASIKVDGPREEEAYNWLEDNEAGDLIKRDVVVSFPKECQDEADALARYARERYQMAGVRIKRAVPWARLTAWVKEQRKAGVLQLPLDLLGATVGRVVKVKPVKES